MYLDFTALDGIGPLGVLGRIPEGKIHYVSLSGGPVVNQAGLTVMTELLDLNSFGGAAAGIDRTMGFVADCFGLETVRTIAESMECRRNGNPTDGWRYSP